jgi:hypothetical protein
MSGRPLTVGLALVAGTAAVGAATLQSKTAAGFNRYAAAVSARLDRELRADGPFLSIERLPPPEQNARRQALTRGEVLVSRAARAQDDSDNEIEIDGGIINHWRGLIFVPRVSLDQLLANLREPGTDRHKQEDVLRSVVVSRDGDRQKVYLRLKRTKVITVYYDTVYDVTYARLTPSRATSTSLSTRIVEVENPGTPQERLRPEGDDHGFMWRLNTYWRYEERDGGVVIEVESVTLSRELPLLLRPVARPIINHIARETLARTLQSIRARFERT